MQKQQREPTWKDIKSILARNNQNELLKLIQQIYGMDKDIKRFIHTKCGLGDTLSSFKKQIESHVYPDPCEPHEEFSLSTARKAISEYRKATDDPLGTLDLMIYYVECGTQCTLDYGDMWEEFYDSPESMFSKAVNTLKEMDKKSIEALLPRLEELVRITKGMGWGYHDGLVDTLYSEFPDANRD